MQVFVQCITKIFKHLCMSLFIFILFKNNSAKTRKTSGGIKKMKKIWIIVSLATIFGTCYEIVIAQETDNKMSFFITSVKNGFIFVMLNKSCA